MSEHCENNTRLQRDGTSRQQRLLKALLPDYVAIDERGIKDLFRFAQQFAKEINDFNSENQVDQSWETFFSSDDDLEILLNDEQDEDAGFIEYVKKKSGYTEPHIALFLAFLKLYKIARDDLNKLTKKHLDYYYKEVLQLKEVPAVADQVFLIFKLARHVENSHIVKQHTSLNAGKDGTGKELVYKTNRDLVVNHAQVDQIKAVFADVKPVTNDDSETAESVAEDSGEEESTGTGNDGTGNKKTYRLYASPVANSSDGKGAEIESDDMSWSTFGWKDRDEADIGFSIASPLLFLSEGNRTVSLTLKFEESSETNAALQQLVTSDPPFSKLAFKVLFSGEEEWISPMDEHLMIEEDQFHPELASDILNFVNTATANQIATKVKDDPNRGYATIGKGYAIGIKVAHAIVEMRDDKGNFKDINDLKNVFGLGQDKIHDLIYTFRNRVHSTKIKPEEYTITIVRTLDESQPSVIRYNREILGDPIETGWPVMKILLNKDAPLDIDSDEPSPYKHLRDLKIEGVKINVDVTGVKSNILQNDTGNLDPGKPFQPFGNRPVIGSSFYIGNWEIFQNELDQLWININWHDLPEKESFGKYYENYSASSDARNNSDFKTEISILVSRKWENLTNEEQLFDSDSDDEPVEPEQTIEILKDAFSDMERAPGMRSLVRYDTSTQRGFLRLRLQGVDFGHKDYAPSYSKQVLLAVTEKDSAVTVTPPPVPGDPSPSNNPADPLLPNEPYTPVISELSLDYRSTAWLDLKQQSFSTFQNRIEQYFHVYPFGISEVDTTKELNNFIPVFDSEGNLYIGLKHFTGGNNISLLFQVAEGSADPDFLQQNVYWSYLSGNEWVPFEDREILSDSTNQLLTSGIISFSVPRKASVRHSKLPDGLVWLRATVQKDTPAISDLVDIRAQAVTATFNDQQNDPTHLAEPLEAETISKLKESDSAIQEIIQPFASFGGAVKEESSAFYTRVSERLRHKHRAVTIWDYERLVLQKFPSVYKVKCLNHTIFKGSLSEYSEIAPGNASLIVVSDMINKNAVDPLKPRTSLIILTQIQEYLEGLKAESVQLYVRNPLYEEIKVDFNVKFRDGIDSGYYQGVLNTEIMSFLSPWAFHTTPDVVFGGRIHKSRILHFIEERAYVDFVTCFKMYHIVPAKKPDEPKVKEVDEAEAMTTASVLGSAPEHNIHVLESEECACDDNKVSAFKELKVDECGC